MDPKEKEIPAVNWKAAKKFVIYPCLTVLGGLLLYLWFASAWPAFTKSRARMAELKPLRTEAAALALTYEKARENPAAAAGKPVVWCVQNRGEDAVTVDGAGDKRLKALNYPMMPLVLGSKHASCDDMLLVINEVPKPGTQLPITVRYIERLRVYSFS
ncbi:MAG: hypothetical protein NTY45_12375 [Elusimicrobia bacterium]|nr:hypothetical protein [Elusimicrobiota bacterium]